MPNLFLLNYKQKASGFCPLKAFCKLKGVWSGWEGIIEVTEPIPSCVAEISQCLQHGEGWLGKHRQGKAAILGSFYNRGQCLRGINTLTPPPTPPRQLQLNYRKSKPPLLPFFSATRVRRHAPRTSTGTHTNTHGRKTAQGSEADTSAVVQRSERGQGCRFSTSIWTVASIWEVLTSESKSF